MVAVLAVVGIALLVFTGNKDDGGTIAGPADAGSSSTFVNSTPDVVPDTSSDTSSSSDPEPTPESSTTTEDAEQQALAQLEALREQSLQQVTPQGQWVAQLASKVPGIVDPEQTTTSGSHTFMAVDILAEHEALANGDNLGASVVLLRSTDYGKRQLYQGQPLWVTFSVGSFFSADDVRSWCAQRFGNLSGESLKNACAPRQLKAIYA